MAFAAAEKAATALPAHPGLGSRPTCPPWPRLTSRPPPSAALPLRSSEGVRATLRGIRRTIGTAAAQKTAINPEQAVQMMRSCPDSLIGRRDTALIAFGLLSPMRRSEIVALTMDDITEVPDGLRIIVRRSKTDAEGRGREIALPRGTKIRPVEALLAWLAAADIATGPVFRPISKGGRIGEGPMTAESVALIVKKLCARLGLDPAVYAGIPCACVEANAPIMKIAETTRHRSLGHAQGLQLPG
jgi:integrase